MAATLRSRSSWLSEIVSQDIPLLTALSAVPSEKNVGYLRH
jgi:hypothetical protein